MRKLAIFLFITLLVISCGTTATAFADTLTATQYTGVLEDLGKDPSFDAAKYNHVANSTLMDVIQIAESVNGELFLYVYQQGGDTVTCSSVNISQDDEATVEPSKKTWSNFKVVLLNSDNVFFKYKVLGLVLKSAVKRYYDVTSILYKPVEPKEPGSMGNVVNEEPVSIAKCFVAQTVGSNVEYSVIQTEVVTIKNKLCGSMRYSSGFTLFKTACDSHWVAFSTDREIDQLFEADVTFHYAFISSKKEYNLFGTLLRSDVSIVEEKDMTETVTYKQTGKNKPIGLFAHTYEWDRIETAEEFLKNDLTPAARSEFERNNYQWVLRFYEQGYEKGVFANGLGGYHTVLEYYSEVSEVMILRLYFRTGARLYNLGVVDNKQSGDQKPDNNDTSAADGAKKEWEEFVKGFKDFWNNYKWFFIAVLIVIVISILSVFVKPVWFVVKNVLKGVWWVLTAPVRLIIYAFSKKEDK